MLASRVGLLCVLGLYLHATEASIISRSSSGPVYLPKNEYCNLSSSYSNAALSGSRNGTVSSVYCSCGGTCDDGYTCCKFGCCMYSSCTDYRCNDSPCPDPTMQSGDRA